MSDHLIDIIIPTYNNIEDLMGCVNSICCHTQSRGILRVIVVNNGDPSTAQYIEKHKLIKFVNAGKNLGWEGGLKLGLEHSDAPYVMFMNDDTYIPYASSTWLLRLLTEFRRPDAGIVGPSTNVVCGRQNIFLNAYTGPHVLDVPFLVFFCAMMRRKDLDAVGGIDDSLPGGDDFDLSIRMKKAGKKLYAVMDTFIYHHGFRTGVRIHGGPDKPNGWNSREMTDKTNMALIRKHGLRAYIECRYGKKTNADGINPCRDTETAVVQRFVKPGVVLELGCGATKTVPDSIGVDLIEKGHEIDNIDFAPSVADVQADVTQPLPFDDGYADTIIARHILEHCMDTVACVGNWAKKLKKDGRLVISVPDESIGLTIPMNPQHKHAFKPDTLKSVAEAVGLKQVEMDNGYNGVSFTSVFSRNGVAHA